MFKPIGDDEDAKFRQYVLIRASVFEPAKPFIIFVFRKSDKLVLSEEDRKVFDACVNVTHHHIKDMELRSDEHEANFVSELVKWEMRQIVEMEKDDHLQSCFQNMLNRTSEWNQNKQERQKRREVVLREEGWDDGFELRVVGIEAGTNQEMVDLAADFRVEQAFNTNRLR
ncbi:hypothetical protein BLNAU_14119 [Blattamonas nauphoetae]|uniref:Uncharacterized protein n=1 Tax=Blattamonas nauphoetae TaxID=2049346 RepID=A0ABQ9XGW7_9EUKA|nr:hypothetical protein BLNAU_14119 [Blattamonas nauphoetae]